MFLKTGDFFKVTIRVRGWGDCSSPGRKKNSIIRAKLMHRSGKDSKNSVLFNILPYLLSPRNSPNLVTDLCTTSRKNHCASVTNKFHSGKLCSVPRPQTKFFPNADEGYNASSYKTKKKVLIKRADTKRM